VKECFVLLGPDRRLLAFVLGVNLVGAALTGIGDPLALKLMIDSLSRSDVRFFLVLTGLMILIYTSYRLLSLLSNLYSQKLRNRLCERLVTSLIQKFYRIPYQEVQAQGRGYFVARLYEEPVKVMMAVSLVVDLFSTVAISLCAMTVCLVLSWRVSLIVSLIVPVLVILSRRYGKKIRSRSLEETENEAQLREGLGRAVESYKNVRLFGLHEKVYRRFDGLLQSLLGSTYRRYKQSATYSTLSGILLSTAETVVMIVAGFQVLAGRLSLGGLFGFVSAYWRVVSSFQTLTGLIPTFATLGAQLDRVQEIKEFPEGAGEGPERTRRWSLRGLSFGYQGSPILEDFDFRWNPGESILVVGANGSGKSTLAHLLTGFLEAQAGESKIPGMSQTSALLSPCAFIPGSLADNLEHASRFEGGAVRARELLATFGLDEKQDRDPASFSDGEKKKAQIIMTLVKDATFYLFDEPLASVDPESKDRIMDAIFARTAGRGLIVILHGDDQFRGRFDRVVDLSRSAPIEVDVPMNSRA
jgi:ATP-binding cassette, subfamily B, bacterial